MLTHLQMLARMAKYQCSDSGLSSIGGLRGWCWTIAHLPRRFSWVSFSTITFCCLSCSMFTWSFSGTEQNIWGYHFIKGNKLYLSLPTVLFKCAFSSDEYSQVDLPSSFWLAWRSGQANRFKFYLCSLIIYKKAIV